MIEWWLTSLFVVWLAAVIFLRVYRIWIIYYIVGTAGLAYAIGLTARLLPTVEVLVAHSVAATVHAISDYIGLPTRVFAGAPAALLVLVVTQPVGWTILNVGVESSALLEMAVLISLLVFYPGWGLRKRMRMITLGIFATWVSNIIRMLFVVGMLHFFGKQALVLAHSVVGKMFFFLVTLVLYMYLISYPTLRDVAQVMRGEILEFDEQP